MVKNSFSVRFLSVLVLLFCIHVSVCAQVVTKGIVVDASDEPIIGANVVETGTTNGIITGLDGTFQLSVKRGATLQVSFVGFISQAVKAGPNVKVVLQEDTETLEEVVVVGYGTTKRKNFTGSVSTMKVSDGGVALTAPTNALDMLRGIAPGLSMTQSGQVGTNPSIQIRGQKSISGGSDPLIVLNGVIFKGTINDIDPSTIESMSVMKDATSLAAYGSQAANGVIMITTKKGERGKPMISFSGSLALNQANYKPEIRDGYQYIELVNARNGKEAGDISWLSPLEKANYDKGEQTDWVDFVSQTGVRQNYSLNISGGGEAMDYMVGASFMNNENFIKGNTFERSTVTARLNTKINKYIKAGLNVNYANMAVDGVRPYYSRYFTPWGEPYMEDGVTLRKYIEGQKVDDQNPLWNVEVGRDHESRNNSINIGAEIEIKIPYIEGLSYKVTGNYTVRNSLTRDFTHENNLVKVADTEYTTDVFDKYLGLASGYVNNTKYQSYVIDNILTYTKEIGKHFMSATLVYTRDSNKADGSQFEGSDFAAIGNTTLGFYGLANATTQKITEIKYSLHNNVGYLGRVNYSYNDTYHFNASIRRDGSSVFGSESKWGTFPAIGVAWSISNEKFWQKALPWATQTKVKASWGKNGNQSLEPYGTLSRVDMGKSGGYTYYFGNNTYYAQSLSTLGNPTLGWETTTSWNFGIETDLLKGGRLHFELDAYTAKTTDQIFNRTIPVMGSGLTNQSSTMGQINNWGVEASLRSMNIKTKDFMWTSNLQFTMSRSILKELYGDGKDDITNELFLNHSLGAIYGYKWIGIIQEGDTEYMSINGGQPGDPMYENVDGSTDGKITPDDRTILGYDKPSFRLSLQNTFSYKNWSLYFLVNGTFSGGKYGYARNTAAFSSYETMQYLNAENHPFWTPENCSNKYLGPKADTSKFTGLQKYGFIRLQDINLSYTFKGVWMKTVGINQLQLYVSGTNLFCFAPDWEFSDPEVRNSRANQLARTYTFGVNLKF